MAYRPQTRIWQPSAATIAVLSYPALRSHLRIDSDDENDVLVAYEAAAVAMVESRTQRLLTRRSCVLRLQDLPGEFEPIELPGGAIGTITSVDVSGTPVTGCVAYGDSPAVLVPAANWPAVTATSGWPVTITYTAGFAAVPPDLLAAIKLIVGELYARRENGSAETIGEVPVSAECLMQPYRIRAIGANA